MFVIIYFNTFGCFYYVVVGNDVAVGPDDHARAGGLLLHAPLPRITLKGAAAAEKLLERIVLAARRCAWPTVRSRAALPGRFSGAASGGAGCQEKEMLVAAQAPSTRAAAAQAP